MSRHQAVRNLDYDEALDEYEGEDFDDENEADQLNPEDRDAMNVGTATVQSALGPDADKVTAQQIQDALWYYYYDIDKTVSYLQKKFIAPPPAPKQEPKKAKDDGFGLESMGGEVTDYDMATVPAVLVPPRPLPGGLLGGGEGPKLSKLQALAAARKKKTATEAKNPDDKVDRAEKRMSTLAIDESSKGDQRPGSSILAKRQKLAADSASGAQAATLVSRPRQDESAPGPSGMDVDDAPSPGNIDEAEVDCLVVPPTRPSAFAQTLFGSAQNSAAASQTYTLPYMDSSTFVPSAFSQPSPDDIVLAAQAKAGTKFDAAAAKSATKKVVTKPTGSQTPTGEMKQLQLDDSTAPKNKKLNVLKEFEKSENKRSASFVVVDVLKATSMLERVR
ncbi:elongation factor Tu GTP binding domain-containing protein [Colletotrichum higginsianum]|nr:elongation factor Tu GTP binding domain-containing protein [Colletotrichum higginsianum]